MMDLFSEHHLGAKEQLAFLFILGFCLLSALGTAEKIDLGNSKIIASVSWVLYRLPILLQVDFVGR